MDLFFKLATSLKKMHDQRICHFDLKEQNIFMMNNYTPVLGDLGMARTIEQATTSKFWGGTPKYLGYKVATRKKNVEWADCKADIYALGVIFY